jgi:hypothetical protein
MLLQEDLSETTPAVAALCKLLLSDQLQEIQQFVPQIVQVSIAGCSLYTADCRQSTLLA